MGLSDLTVIPVFQGIEQLSELNTDINVTTKINNPNLPQQIYFTGSKMRQIIEG